MSPRLPAGRRLLTVGTALILAVAMVAAGCSATGPAPPSHDSGASTAAHPTASRRIDGPDQAAARIAAALYGYDTRRRRAEWRSSLLTLAGAIDGSPAALDLDRRIPDNDQWAQMGLVHQRAVVTIHHVFVPELWTRTVQQHPELPAGATGLTVAGIQRVSWDGGTSRVPVEVTVLLLCPPATSRCQLNRMPALVAR